MCFVSSHTHSVGTSSQSTSFITANHWQPEKYRRDTSALFLVSSLGLPKLLLPSARTSPGGGSEALCAIFRELSDSEGFSPCFCPAGSPSVFASSLPSLVQALAPTRATWRSWGTSTWWKATRGGCASTLSGGPSGTTGPWKTSALSLTAIWTSALSTQGSNCECPCALTWTSAPGNTCHSGTLYTWGAF